MDVLLLPCSSLSPTFLLPPSFSHLLAPTSLLPSSNLSPIFLRTPPTFLLPFSYLLSPTFFLLPFSSLPRTFLLFSSTILFSSYTDPMLLTITDLQRSTIYPTHHQMPKYGTDHPYAATRSWRAS
eukprot:1411560-Rhodomonas_salina.1